MRAGRSGFHRPDTSEIPTSNLLRMQAATSNKKAKEDWVEIKAGK